MLVVGTAAGAMIPTYAVLVVIWLVVGFGYSVAQTPSGRLVRRSAHPEDRPAVFAAQFALSHACWLLAYPLAGLVGARWGMTTALAALTLLAALGLILAWRLWPALDPDQVQHRHDDLPADHPHLQQHRSVNGIHRHPLVIDELHQRWPH